ncbi:hypothetical protein [Glycomyces sp. YM15]|uniref:hypothetical protein n=1 Tax=Glycomyces sp. YM15 TaxID=2800446 RepID=UPI0019644D3E|nr:hypothetical protein [Glycomyces sp. YM15]
MVSTTVQARTAQPRNAGGTIPRRSIHSTVKPSVSSGTPKPPTLSQYAAIAGLIAITPSSGRHRSPLNHAAA